MAEASIPRSTGLVDRMIRASRLDAAVYNEIEADTGANGQAVTVVIVAVLASGIGAAIGAALRGTGDSGAAIIGGLIGGVITPLIGWVVWSFVVYLVGTKMFAGTADFGEVLRTQGFAYSPIVLNVLRFIPVLGGLIVLATFIWHILAGYVAVREALDISGGSAVATIVIAFLIELVLTILLSVVVFAAIFGAAVATGGLSG